MLIHEELFLSLKNVIKIELCHLTIDFFPVNAWFCFGVLYDLFLTFWCCLSNREVQTWKLFK